MKSYTVALSPLSLLVPQYALLEVNIFTQFYLGFPIQIRGWRRSGCSRWWFSQCPNIWWRPSGAFRWTWDLMWFLVIWDTYLGTAAMAMPTEWVEPLNEHRQDQTKLDLGQISILNHILHQYLQIRLRPIAGRPAEERPPCILNRKMIFLFRLKKVKRNKKMFQIACSLVHYRLNAFSGSFQTLFKNMFGPSRNRM